MTNTTEITLAYRLKTETHTEHDRMESLMEKADIFSSISQYRQFTLSQYYFQLEIENLFAKDGVADIVEDIDTRGRAKLALEDLNDLQITPKGTTLRTKNIVLPEALGWIYVSEGSTLGAAILLKEAQNKLGLSATNGARNLAAYPDGRMRVWKRFVQYLNETSFTKEEQDLVIKGAMDAFSYFGEMLENIDVLQ